MSNENNVFTLNSDSSSSDESLTLDDLEIIYEDNKLLEQQNNKVTMIEKSNVIKK